MCVWKSASVFSGLVRAILKPGVPCGNASVSPLGKSWTQQVSKWSRIFVRFLYSRFASLELKILIIYLLKLALNKTNFKRVLFKTNLPVDSTQAENLHGRSATPVEVQRPPWRISGPHGGSAAHLEVQRPTWEVSHPRGESATHMGGQPPTWGVGSASCQYAV